MVEESAIFPKALQDQMHRVNIDPDEATKLLKDLRGGRYDHVKPLRAKDIPAIDGESVIDLSSGLRISRKDANQNVHQLGMEISLNRFAMEDGSDYVFSINQLELLGTQLTPLLGFGLLNGGSASSYLDLAKNA
ncbi:MAG: hypothetical protein AABZ14_00695, partial [Candidatus Margulisiibacteriota bacterium]